MVSRLPVVRRGFSPDEVRKLLHGLSQGIAHEQVQRRALQAQVEELKGELDKPPTELTEAVVAKLLGEQAAQILRNSAAASSAIREKAEIESRTIMNLAQKERQEASDVASTMLAEARERSTDLISSAQSEATAIIKRADEAAQDRLISQETLAKDVVAKANQLASDTIQSAQRSADKIMAESQAEATSLISSARETRTEILSDLRMRADEVRSHIETLSRTRGWFIEMLKDAQRRVTSVESALSISMNSDLESLEGSLAALNLSTIEVRNSSSDVDKFEKNTLLSGDTALTDTVPIVVESADDPVDILNLESDTIVDLTRSFDSEVESVDDDADKVTSDADSPAPSDTVRQQRVSPTKSTNTVTKRRAAGIKPQVHE